MKDRPQMKDRLQTDKKTALDAINSTFPPHSDNLPVTWGLKPLISLVTFLCLSSLAYAQNAETDHFLLKITTTAGTNANDKSFTFYTEATGYDIDWDNDQNFDTLAVSGNQFHTFPTAGVHTIRFRNLTDIYIRNQLDRRKYTSIEQWGTSVWNADMREAFQGAKNLTIKSTAGTPNMSAVTDMSYMFSDADGFNSGIGDWNTALVTDMSYMFSDADDFNSDIGNWNTALVTDMSYMFSNAGDFNSDIGDWNTASVTNMSFMFYSPSFIIRFNQDIGRWNTAQVTNMESMFGRAVNFNQDIGNWNVEAVTNMARMFQNAAAFNKDIGNWNVEAVTNMARIFQNAAAFNKDISRWNTAQVTNMARIFQNAAAFNKDISRWNTAQVTNMARMFQNATSFDRDISRWNTATVIDMRSMFNDATSFNQDISRWNTAQVTNMGGMFDGATSFNQDIGGWNVRKVRVMSSMFNGATVFIQNLGPWYIRDGELIMGSTIMAGDVVATITAQNTVLNAHNPEYTLSGADANFFTLTTGGDLTRNATVATVGKTSYTITIASTGQFGTNNQREVTITLNEAGSVANFITTWRTTTANESITIPTIATSDGDDYYNYVVHWGDGSSESGKTGDATHTYASAGDYTVSIGGVFPRIYFNHEGDKSKIRDVTQWGNTAWTSMAGAFQGANNLTMTATDAPDLSGVTNMNFMFSGATSFDQNIGGWNVEAVRYMHSMFSGVTLSLANYASLLVGWNAQNLKSGVTFHGGNSVYMSTQAQTARANMISSTGHDWTITDGGLITMNQAPTDIFLSSTNIAENAGANAVVGMLSNTDTGGTYVYTLVTGGGDADNGSFRISGTELQLQASANYETKRNYSIRIKVRSGPNDFEKSFTISVDDVNEAPTASDVAFSVAENSANDTTVGTVTATDQDSATDPNVFSLPNVNGTLTYAITGGNTGNVFAIDPTTGAITVAGALDYETTPSYSLVVTVTDGGSPSLSATATLTITVTDVANEHAPVFAGGATATVSYAENATTAVTTVIATDADAGQTVSFTLSGADAGLFSITQAEGELTFNTAPDYENPVDTGMDNMYEVTITATDDGTPAMTATQTLTITVTDVDEQHANNAPVFEGGATATVSYAENATTAVTTVIATDADAGQTVSFTLSGADGGQFSITQAGGELTFNTAPDYENPVDMGGNNVYEVTVTATDDGTPAMSATQTLTITVTDVVDGGAGPTLGLEAFTGVEVYPNPVGAVLHISGVAGNARYTLSSIDGKMVKRGKLKADKVAHSVAIPSLNKGIYVLQLTTGKGSITRKIVKE